MGESLFQCFLDEEVEDINKAFLLWGVAGILSEFENWLRRKGHIVS